MGTYTTNQEIYAEMARRKVQFHPEEKWDEIKLWGLFMWGAISRMIKSGKLKTEMRRENRVVWVTPTRETWEKEINPLIEKYTLKELSIMAGWDVE